MDKLIDMKQLNNLNAAISSSPTTTTTSATKKLIQARLPFQPVRRTTTTISSSSSINTTTATTTPITPKTTKTTTTTVKESPRNGQDADKNTINKLEIIEIDDNSNEKSSSVGGIQSNKNHPVEIFAGGIKKRKHDLLSPPSLSTAAAASSSTSNDEENLIIDGDDDDDDDDDVIICNDDSEIPTITATNKNAKTLLFGDGDADDSISTNHKSQKKHKKKPKPFKKLHIKLPLPKKRKLSESVARRQQPIIITISDGIPDNKKQKKSQDMNNDNGIQNKNDDGDDDDDDVLPIKDVSEEMEQQSTDVVDPEIDPDTTDKKCTDEHSIENSIDHDAATTANDIQLITDEKIELSQSNHSNGSTNHDGNEGTNDEITENKADNEKGEGEEECKENKDNNDEKGKDIEVEDKDNDNDDDDDDKDNNDEVNDDKNKDNANDDEVKNDTDDDCEDDDVGDADVKVILSETDSSSIEKPVSPPLLDNEMNTPKRKQHPTIIADPNPTRKLTPKQQRHRDEMEKRQRDKQLAKEERDRKLQEEKELRQKERDEKERQRRKEKEEKEEVRRREREEKEEQRRKERDEREQKRLAEVAAKNEERRKRQEDEQRKQKEEADLKAKKKATEEKITKFFIPTSKLNTIGGGGGGGGHAIGNTNTLGGSSSSLSLSLTNLSVIGVGTTIAAATPTSTTLSVNSNVTSSILTNVTSATDTAPPNSIEHLNVCGAVDEEPPLMSSSNNPTNLQSNFMPFCIKGDMKLAPIIRRILTNDERNEFEKLCCSNDNDLDLVDCCDRPPRRRQLYFESIKTNQHLPIKTGKQKSNTADDDDGDDEDDDDEDDCCIIDDDFDGGDRPIIEKPAKQQTHRAKLFQFHENQRPPYYGTWRKKSDVIRSINPFVKDPKYFDYEIDSDDEWEEEEPGESLRGSDDEHEDGGGAADDYDIDNEFFVPHGHLSDEELLNNKNSDGEDDDDDDDDDDGGNCDGGRDKIINDNSPAIQKAKLEIIQKNFVAEMKKKTEKIKPRLIGLMWVTNDGRQPPIKCSTAIWNKLEMYSAMFAGDCVRLKSHQRMDNDQTVMTTTNGILNDNYYYYNDDDDDGDNDEQQQQRENTTLSAAGTNPNYQKRIKISETADVIDLIHLIHGNTNNIRFLIKEFQAHRQRKKLGNEKCPELSNISLRNKIKELAEWRACPDDGPFQNKYCWYMSKETRLPYELDHLTLPNVWQYILPLSNKSGKIKELGNLGTQTQMSSSIISSGTTNNANKTLISSLNLMPLNEANGMNAIPGTTISTTSTTTTTVTPKSSTFPSSMASINLFSINKLTNASVSAIKKKVPILMSLPCGQKMPTKLTNNLISQYLQNISPKSINKKLLLPPIKSQIDDDNNNNNNNNNNNKSKGDNDDDNKHKSKGIDKFMIRKADNVDDKINRIETPMELSSSEVLESSKNTIDVVGSTTIKTTAVAAALPPESKQSNNIINLDDDDDDGDGDDVSEPQQQPMEVDNEIDTTVTDCPIVID